MEFLSQLWGNIGFELGANMYGLKSMNKSSILLYNQSEEGKLKHMIGPIAALLCGIHVLSFEYLVHSRNAGIFLPCDEYVMLDAQVTEKISLHSP